MKKVLSLCLALAMLLSMLAACSPSAKNPDDGFDPQNNTIGYQWADSSAPILAEKNQEISFEIISSKNALALDYNSMDVFQDLAASTNVNVNWKNLSESAYATQKSLILANSKNYPDAIYHAGFTNKELIQYGTSRNVIVAIDEYLEYMPNLKAILEARPDIRAAIESPDGHIYSLPRIEEMGLKAYPNILFINKEWVGKLIDAGELSFELSKEDLVDGLKLTRNQYKEVLSKFKALDMNGNGDKNDEIPMSFVHGNWQGNEYDLIASFGIPDNADHKTIVDGKVVFTVQDVKWKDAVSELAGWVKDGLIEVAAFEDGQDAFLAKGKVDSKGYEKLGSFYWWEMETVISEQEQENYIVMQPLVDDATGKQYVSQSNLQEVEKGVCVIFEKCQYKEILLTYLDRFYDPYVSAQINYGAIGVVYEEELDENGKLVTKELPDGVTTDELRLKNAPMGICYLADEIWKNYVNMEPRAQLRLERLEKYVKPFTYEGQTAFPNISYTLEEINELNRYEGNLGDIIGSQFMKWILAGTEISDAEWEEFQQKLKKAGIEEVKKINQEGYDRYIEGMD